MDLSLKNKANEHLEVRFLVLSNYLLLLSNYSDFIFE
jgi:hypothetical protein